MRQLKQLTACYELKPEVQNKFTTKVGTSAGRPKISNRHRDEDTYKETRTDYTICRFLTSGLETSGLA